MNIMRLRQTATPNLFCLEGRIAFITGAGGYLGKDMAEALCEAGAYVIVNGRTSGRIKELAEALQAKGYQVKEAIFDVRNESELQRLFDWIKERHGKLGSVPVTCETPRKRRKNKRAFVPITRYRDTTSFSLSLPGLSWI